MRGKRITTARHDSKLYEIVDGAAAFYDEFNLIFSGYFELVATVFAGTIEPLATENRKYFHPSRSLWQRVPDRKSAWRIKPSYYLWLPATEVAFPVADFRKHFALIVSIRVDPTVSILAYTSFFLSSYTATHITFLASVPPRIRRRILKKTRSASVSSRLHYYHKKMRLHEVGC